MINFAAHYIWQGKKRLFAKQSVLVSQNHCWSLLPLKQEMAQTRFYNGVILPVVTSQKTTFVTTFNSLISDLEKKQTVDLQRFLEKQLPEVDWTQPQTLFLLNCDLQNKQITATSTLIELG